jgi:GxxExxY protein
LQATYNKFILGAQVYLVVNAALEVLNKLGHGFHEKPYENALVFELGLRRISCQQQRSYNVVYKGKKVGEYIPDLIADGTIIVEPKVVDRISDHERGRMINYLRITGLSVGLILNFRRAKLEWERIVLSDAKSRIDPTSSTIPKQAAHKLPNTSE